MYIRMTFMFVVILCLPALGQEETLFGDDEVDHGGFGAVVVKPTTVNGHVAILVGGRGGWIINHALSIGFGGYGLSNDVPALAVGRFDQRYVQFGYGGLELEFVANSDRVLHTSIQLLLGGGSAGFRYGMFETTPWDNGDFGIDGRSFHEMDEFFIAEPGITADLNVTSWFRVSAGLSYRYVSGLRTRSTTNTDVGTASGVIMFRFGDF